MTTSAYHQTRLSYDPKRVTLWRTLVKSVFQRHIGAKDSVLELGAGYGDFINSVRADRRFAIDTWEGMLRYLEPGVEGIVSSITNLSMIPEGSIDFVFASNILEHVSQEEAAECLAQLRRKMKTGGSLNIIQPNFRYSYREYFDDYTHKTIYTDTGLSAFLEANRFAIIECIPKFLPFSIKSHLPVHPLLIRAYLRSPFKPLGKQMLVRARLLG